MRVAGRVLDVRLCAMAIDFAPEAVEHVFGRRVRVCDRQAARALCVSLNSANRGCGGSSALRTSRCDTTGFHDRVVRVERLRRARARTRRG